LGYGGGWWSSSGAGSGVAWYHNLGYADAHANRSASNGHRLGVSVRCARD
jgi:hypothetical protein